jgi:hypothetical protein
MKTRLLCTLSVLLLLLLPFVSFSQAPNLGVTSTFALFTGTGAFDNTGASVVTGDIGSNVSPITGFPNPGTVVGLTQQSNAISAQAAIDVNVAYGELSALSVFTTLGTTMGSGQVLTAGIYHTGAATTINGDLILNGEGNANALFIIKIGGALSTGTFANIVLQNSASMCNVYWQVEGQFQLGQSSVFRGTVIANGAIDLLEGSSLLGRGLTRAGAISLHNNVVSAVMKPTASVITAGGATTFCAGGNVVLSGNVGGTWSNAAGSTSATLTVTTAGDYYVTNTNACGIVTSNHITVSINPAPTASVITAGSALALCSGASVVLSGNVGGVWNNAAGSTTASITVTAAGDYYVTNTNGCGSVASNHITVTTVAAPVTSVITAGGATTFCAGGSVVLSGNVGGVWSNAAATTPTLTVTTAGDYYVTNTTACGSVTSNHITVSINPAPTASVITAGSTIALCSGASVVLSGNVGGVWNNAASSTTASITVTTAGDYYVTNTNGCGSVASNHITVTTVAAPVASVITAGSATTFCAGGSVVLSGNVGGVWSNAAHATTPTLTITTAGDYYVTNTTACGSVTSNHISVTVNPAPTASVITAGSAIALCTGGSVVLSGNVGGVWNNAAGSTTGSITVTTAGDYYVTNTNDCGSVISNHKIVTINALPLAIAGDNAAICVGNSETLGTTPISGHTYSWTPATGLSSTTVANPVATPLVTTTYTLTETITASGCQASNAVTVAVNAVPTVSTSACVGGSVSFSATAVGTGVTYQWRNGTVNLVDGGNISGATSATLTISPLSITDASTNYNVVITGACTSSVTPLSLALNVLNAPVIVTQPLNQTACVGNSASFSAGVSGIGLTYQWRKGTVNIVNGGNISGANSATLTINPVNAMDVASNYNVVITGACSSVTSTSANASLALGVATGVSPFKVSDDKVSIYPNPSKTSINIDILDASQLENAALKLYDAMGKMVSNTNLTTKLTTLKTTNFPTGIYLYKVLDNDKTIQSGKLIFQE